MKKYFIMLAALLLAVLLTACSEKASGENAAAETGEEGTSMVMVADDAEFAEKMGIAVDTSLVPVESMARYIVNNEVVYFCFGLQEGEGEPAVVLLRATKNSDLKDSLSEIQGTDTPLDNQVINGVNVARKDVTVDDQTYHQYDFEKDGIYYCLVTRGDISEEQFNELFASFLEAVRPA